MSTHTPPISPSPPGTKAPKSSPRRATIAAFSGAFIEWYAFYLYGTAAAIVFPRVFFPEADPTIAVIQSFGTFATGFLLRPVGAILFGHFGDKIGRKPVLIFTILLMGISTFLIGFLPGYETIGIWAVILLVSLRLMDGLAIGGEFGGGALLALENAPKNKRGLLGSFHQMGTPVGLLVSTGTLALVQLMPEDQFFEWGWRIPFFLCGVFTLAAFWIRRGLPDTPVFQQEEGSSHRIPLFALVRQSWRNLLLGLGARMADAVTFNIINVFAVSFVTTYLGMSSGMILAGFTIAAAVQVFITPAVGALSDRLGRRPVYMTGIAICAIGGFFYFPVISMGSTLSTWLIIILVQAVGTGFMFSIQGAFFAEMFGTRTRYSGLGIVYQGSALIGGAPTPAIAAALTSVFAGSYWPAVIYMVTMCVISAICVLLVSENSKLDLNDTDAIVKSQRSK